MEEKLMHLKEQLLAREKELKVRIDEPHSKDTGELSHYDNHPADTATELSEREKEAVLHQQVADELHEVTHALEKFSDGTYGICEKTGEVIPYERLEAYPTARTVASCSSELHHVAPQVGVLTNNYFAEEREFDAYERVADFNDRTDIEDEGDEIGERLSTGITGFRGTEKVYDQSTHEVRTSSEPE